MKRIVTILILALALTTTLTAQNNGRTKFATDMYQAKHEMIIQEVGLTQTQQKQFMPLYEQMEREIYQVNRNARALAAEVEKKFPQFFKLLLTHVKQGFYGHPRHGGNAGWASYRMLGIAAPSVTGRNIPGKENHL